MARLKIFKSRSCRMLGLPDSVSQNATWKSLFRTIRSRHLLWGLNNLHALQGCGLEGMCTSSWTIQQRRLVRFSTVAFFLRHCSYDVYTPTQNIVYHNYQPNSDGHGPMEWLKPRFERFRRAALNRVRSYLELPRGLEGYNLANLGIYGLGKRRSLHQLAEFCRIDMTTQGSRPQTVRNT